MECFQSPLRGDEKYEKEKKFRQTERSNNRDKKILNAYSFSEKEKRDF